jgi:site-specific recombinase XerD
MVKLALVPTDQKAQKATGLKRPKNDDMRPRKWLFANEVYAMVAAAKKTGRHGERDAALILLGFRCGFRVAELVDLKWSDVDLDSRDKTLRMRRIKKGKPGHHYLKADEIKLLRALQKDSTSNHVFVSERGDKLSTQTVRHILNRAAKLAGMSLRVSPHMLRHGCGFDLANRDVDTRRIQDYLGHRNIQHTVTYTELAKGRFRDLW